MTQTLRFLLTALLLLWASCEDLRRQRIPNFLTAGSACVGLILALFSGWEGLKSSLTGFLAALLLGILLWLLGAFRAGDAKLYAALGMLLGWRGVLGCFLWSMVAAGAAGFVLLLVKGELKSRAKRLWDYCKLLFLTRRIHYVVIQAQVDAAWPEHEFPLAPSIVLGWLLSLCFPLFPPG